MGLLDDAIREHLDLKRRRGGDPAEIERAEREALGPVRRNREAPPAEDTGELVASRDAFAGAAVEEPDEGVATDLDDETGEHPTLDGEPRAAFVDDDDPFAGDDQPFDDDAPATRVMRVADIPAADVPALSEHTAEFDVEEALAAEDEPLVERAPEPPTGEDDVLEETPEFLQDTPDHDRLWFEQRPPRDFDFDG